MTEFLSLGSKLQKQRNVCKRLQSENRKYISASTDWTDKTGYYKSQARMTNNRHGLVAVALMLGKHISQMRG